MCRSGYVLLTMKYVCHPVSYLTPPLARPHFCDIQRQFIFAKGPSYPEMCKYIFTLSHQPLKNFSQLEQAEAVLKVQSKQEI